MTTRSAAPVALGTPVHASPFDDATARSGCRAYGVYNGLRVPVSFESPQAEYWRRTTGAVLRDASADCHVEIAGSDATAFVEWLTATRIDGLTPGCCAQALLSDEQGGVVGYPLILRLDAERFWLAQEGPDLLPWVKGASLNSELDFRVTAPRVATLALEGVRAPEVLAALLAEHGDAPGPGVVRDVRLGALTLTVSPRGGVGVPAYSLRLQDAAHAGTLWDRVLDAGAAFDVGPGALSSVHRVEAGIPGLAFDMDAGCDPFELGLGHLVDLDREQLFIGKAALTALRARGQRRRMMGVVIDGPPMDEPNVEWWPLTPAAADTGEEVGEVRSAVWSPRLEGNIGLAMVLLAHAEPGVRVDAHSSRGVRTCTLRELPIASPA